MRAKFFGQKTVAVNKVAVGDEEYNFYLTANHEDIFTTRGGPMPWSKVKGCGNDAIVSKAIELRQNLEKLGLL